MHCSADARPLSDFSICAKHACITFPSQLPLKSHMHERAAVWLSRAALQESVLAGSYHTCLMHMFLQGACCATQKQAGAACSCLTDSQHGLCTSSCDACTGASQAAVLGWLTGALSCLSESRGVLWVLEGSRAGRLSRGTTGGRRLLVPGQCMWGLLSLLDMVWQVALLLIWSR